MSKLMDKIEKDDVDMKGVYDIENIEEQLEIEAKKILKAKQQKQMRDMRDTQYYAVVIFGNEFDKNKFISKLKDIEIEGDTYIDGYELAKSIGIDIEMTASLPDPHFVKQLKIKKNGNKFSR